MRRTILVSIIRNVGAQIRDPNRFEVALERARFVLIRKRDRGLEFRRSILRRMNTRTSVVFS